MVAAEGQEVVGSMITEPTAIELTVKMVHTLAASKHSREIADQMFRCLDDPTIQSQFFQDVQAGTAPVVLLDKLEKTAFHDQGRNPDHQMSDEAWSELKRRRRSGK
jgi:hypothetical protein